MAYKPVTTKLSKELDLTKEEMELITKANDKVRKFLVKLLRWQLKQSKSS